MVLQKKDTSAYVPIRIRNTILNFDSATYLYNVQFGNERVHFGISLGWHFVEVTLVGLGLRVVGLNKKKVFFSGEEHFPDFLRKNEE